MTTILEQLDQALDDILRSGLDVTTAADELMYITGPGSVVGSTRIIDAVTAMRLAMTDPSCVDQLDGDRPVFSSESVGRTAYSDPTGQAAIVKNAARTQHRDLVRAISILSLKASVVLSSTAADDTAGANRALRTVTTKAGYVAAMVTRWQPRMATAKERAETEGDMEPGCVSCARTEVRPGVKRWVPVSRGDYCRWCSDWKRKTGEAPPLAKLEAHHDGRRVMMSA